MLRPCCWLLLFLWRIALNTYHGRLLFLRHAMLLFLRFHDLCDNRLVFKTIIQCHEGRIPFPPFCCCWRGCISAGCSCYGLLRCFVSGSGSRTCCYCMVRSTYGVFMLFLLVKPLTSCMSAVCCCCWRQLFITPVRDLVIVGVADDSRVYFSYQEYCTWRASFLNNALYQWLEVFLWSEKTMSSISVTQKSGNPEQSVWEGNIGVTSPLHVLLRRGAFLRGMPRR